MDYSKLSNEQLLAVINTTKYLLTKGIPYTTIWKSSLKNTAISKGKAKGWLCQKI